MALFTTAFGAFWVQLLGHEAAHALGRDLFVGDADLAVHWPRRVQIAYFAGGPVFTLLLVALAAALALRLRTSRGRMVAASVGLSAASRSAWTALAGLLGRPHDELTVARLLGFPTGVLELTEILVTAAAVVAILRVLPLPGRRGALLWIMLGIIAGWVSALTIGNALGVPVGVF